MGRNPGFCMQFMLNPGSHLPIPTFLESTGKLGGDAAECPSQKPIAPTEPDLPGVLPLSTTALQSTVV